MGIRSSICTGKRAAGFRASVSEKFKELMLLRGDRELSEFFKRYQVEASEVKREW